MRRSIVVALLLSALLHLLVLAAPGWYVGNPLLEDSLPLEAHLVVPKAAASPQKKPRKLPDRIAPIVQQAPAVPDVVAAAEPQPKPQADPAPPAEPVAEPVTDVIPEVVPPLPRKGRIRFSIMRGDDGFAVAQSVHEWHHDGQRYALTATSETTGIAAIFKAVKRVQTSEGGFLKGELKPENFRDDRGGGDVATASFDWAAQQVTITDGRVVPINDGAEDLLSMFYQLMQAAQRGEGFVMAVATGRKVERYAFEWLGEEELDLKPGRFHAWHVRVRAASGGKDTTEVWLGKEVAGLPIKIRFTDRKGDIAVQVAVEIEYEGK